MSTHAFICDAIRTPFGRYGGALSSVRTDDLGAIPINRLCGSGLDAVGTAGVNQLVRSGGRYALCTMCMGVGQGIALVLERV